MTSKGRRISSAEDRTLSSHVRTEYCQADVRLPMFVWSIVLLIISGCETQAPQLPRDGEREEQISRVIVEVDPPRSPERPSGIVPNFRMLTAEAGFSFKRFDDISDQRRILEVNGGGVGIIDFDLDGREDIFMTNGCQLPVEEHDHRTPGALYRNQGDMKFTDVSSSSRLLQYGFKHGCAVGDWDADGFDDLYLTAFGRNEFWRNNGDGSFSEVALSMGVDAPEWSSSAAFADVNQDGWLDLYVVNYLNETAEDPTLCPNSASPGRFDSCSPAIFDAVPDRLFISDGVWTARDASATSGINSVSGKGLGLVIVDLNDDQTPEIYVANDGQENFLFAQGEESTGNKLAMTDVALSANVALNESGFAQASMGIAVADFDRTGTHDLFLTHFYGDTNTFFANEGDLYFSDRTRATRLGPCSREYLGFGTTSVDFDNDGWIDLFVANGHVEDREWIAGGQPYRMLPQLFRNENDGTFSDIGSYSGSYFEQKWVGRGVAAADLNSDEQIDLVISHQIDRSAILQNETQTDAKALRLRLIGADNSNRSAIGSRVRVSNVDPPMSYFVSGGGSFQSASTKQIHIGLGESTRVDLVITWPSGHIQQVENVTAGMWTVVEGRSKPFRDDRNSH